MALSRPPAEPGGGVICVKVAGTRPAPPLRISAPRIQASQASPKAEAA